jgi:hypothetical protein
VVRWSALHAGRCSLGRARRPLSAVRVSTGGARRPLSISHDGTTADDLLLMDILWSDPTDRPQTALPSCTSRGSHAPPTSTCTHARTRSLVSVRAGARRRCAGSQ